MRRGTVQMVFMALALGATAAAAQEPPAGDVMDARIWLDRGDDPILQRGDRVRIYYRVNTDSYVALFHIDTDGSVTLLYPRGPGEDDFVRADRDYRLLYPSSSYWYVDEYPGKGYFFLVASSQPFSFDDYGYSSYDHQWDLTQVGQSVYSDPYVAMDDHVAHLIPDWETVPYALDFTSYDVGQAHDYPRFMCYECHGYRSYTSWDPYTYGCSAVRVVIWDDPYYYPTYRYQGTRVVLARRRYGVPRYEFKDRAAGESWRPLTRTRQPPSRAVQYAEPGVARGSTSSPATRRAVPRDMSGAVPEGVGTTRAVPRSTPEPPRHPLVPRDGATSRSPTDRSATDRPGTTGRIVPSTTRVAPPSSSGSPVVSPPGEPRERPTLQRRPTTATTPTRGGRPIAPRTSGGSTIVTPRPTTSPATGSVGTTRGREPATTRTSPPRSVTPGRTATPRPTTSVRPSTPPPRPALTPRPRSGGSGGRPTAQPRRTGGSGGKPTAQPRRTGGSSGRPTAQPRRTGGGGRPAARPSRPSRSGGGSRSAPPRRSGGGGASRPARTAHRRGGGGA